jgi:hypothetical protein
MSETYTPQASTAETNNEEPIEDNFAAINEWQQAEASRRAQALINVPVEPEDTNDKAKWGTKVAVTTGIVIGAALGAGGTAVGLDHVLPGEQVASASTSVQNGEGLEQSVDRDISQIEAKKIDPADTTERQDVISQAVEFHTDSNGIVQPGEKVTVIAEKSPIFGNIRYEAVPNPATSNETTVQLPLPPAINTDGTIPAPDTH